MEDEVWFSFASEELEVSLALSELVKVVEPDVGESEEDVESVVAADSEEDVVEVDSETVELSSTDEEGSMPFCVGLGPVEALPSSLRSILSAP